MMNSEWYDSLNKPAFTPTGNIFAPAWTILYLLILLSFVIFINSKTDVNKVPAVILFVIQLLLNFAWSPVFFYLQNPIGAFVIIILLDIFVLLTIISFYKLSPIAAMLLIPYFLWICFATYLNYGFVVLN